MADQNPKGGGNAVPLGLPGPHIKILCRLLSCWLAGVREDLQMPKRLKNPERARRNADAYQRLLDGVERGEVVIPDKEARAVLADAAQGNDDGNGYAQAVAEHDALHGLLSVLDRTPA